MKVQISSLSANATLATYEAACPADALDALARDRGFATYPDACEAGCIDPDDIRVALVASE